MNGKKLLTTVVAGLTAFACSVTVLTGCGPNHTHSYDYTVTTPATCVASGERHGVCRICNKEVNEVIPLNPDAHAYGEWDITIVPTETTAGKAKKTCGLDNHVLEVDLPKLSDVATEDDKDKSGKYDEKDIVTVVAPKALHEGERQYTYKHDSGDVVFSVAIPARGVGTVADAIDALTEKHSEVRSGEGKYGYSRRTMLNQPDYVNKPGNYSEYTNFNYQFGDNYTHSYESGNGTEKWCSLDENGDLFAFTSTGRVTEGGRPIIEKEIDENYLQGSKIPIIGTDMNGYGAEGLLRNLYAIGANNNNKDYEERYSAEDGYYFKFGYISRNTDGLQTLAIVEVTFNLTELYTLDKLTIEANAYVNMPGEYDTDEEGNLNKDSAGKPIEIKTWEMDEEGIGRLVVKEKTGYRFIVEVNVTQTTNEQAEKEGIPVPENPYSRDEVMFTGFDLEYAGNKVDENTPLPLVAGSAEGSGIFIKITDMVPASAVNYNFDTITVYLLDNGKEIPLGSNITSSASLTCLYAPTSFTVRAYLTGEVKLKVASKYVTRYVTLNVAPTAPSLLSPAVYEYSDTGYLWKDADSGLTTVRTTVRVGQPLWFSVSPVNLYEYGGWYVTRILDSKNNNTPVTDDVASASEEMKTVGGREVREFVANKAGEYVLQFRTTFEGATNGGSIRITVEDIPDMASEISGTYSARVTYPQRGMVTVEISLSGSQGTATVTDSQGSREVLSFTFTQTKTSVSIQSAHSGSANLGYVLGFNDAWRLTITHPSIEDETETVVLTKQS